MKRLLAALLLLTPALLTCASADMGVRDASELIEEGKPDEAIARLVPLRDKYPQNAQVRDELARAYYRSARKALEEERSADYQQNLEHALDEWVESVRIDPTSSHPHTMMAIVRLHQGDLDGSIANLKNARRLEPTNPGHYANLGEAYVYKGQLEAAHRYLQHARRFHGSRAYIELVESLAAWKSGDMVEADDLFASAVGTTPEVVHQWNEAPVARDITDFEDFAEFCCGDIACGPYMKNQCKKAEHAVAERKIDAETARKELLLEMERRRKLNEIYQSRKDLQIEVEKPEDVK